MPTIRPNLIDLKTDFIWTATAAAEFVPVYPSGQTDDDDIVLTDRPKRINVLCRWCRGGVFRVLRHAFHVQTGRAHTLTTV
jgi:hypothetical protein